MAPPLPPDDIIIILALANPLLVLLVSPKLATPLVSRVLAEGVIPLLAEGRRRQLALDAAVPLLASIRSRPAGPTGDGDALVATVVER